MCSLKRDAADQGSQRNTAQINTALVKLQPDKAAEVCTEKAIFLSSERSGSVLPCVLAVLTLHILQAGKATAGQICPLKAY